MVNVYLLDLEAEKAGDVNRFGRMVDGKGGSLGNPAAWRNYVKAFLSDENVIEVAGDALLGFALRAVEVGVKF